MFSFVFLTLLVYTFIKIKSIFFKNKKQKNIALNYIQDDILSFYFLINFDNNVFNVVAGLKSFFAFITSFPNALAFMLAVPVSVAYSYPNPASPEAISLSFTSTSPPTFTSALALFIEALALSVNFALSFLNKVAFCDAIPSTSNPFLLAVAAPLTLALASRISLSSTFILTPASESVLNFADSPSNSKVTFPLTFPSTVTLSAIVASACPSIERVLLGMSNVNFPL